ncbi:MAG: S-methyl-5-thioribose-1-phosphate isomerase, partial [Planctomycetes bacterium]|nr:S-methyl-5-thioribose-1-phosphate isomerase [Planctomycetota bacterium]
MFPTVAWKNGSAQLIDQTLLPQTYKIITVRTPREMWKAIKRLAVRGAPAIGIAAAYGVLLGVQKSRAKTWGAFKKELDQTTKYLATSRPTAVNLFWALERMTACAKANRKEDIPRIIKALQQEAASILEEDRAICRAIGKHGAKLVRKGWTLLTHCNAGGLATSGYGTALAVIFTAHAAGKKISVFADETRPLLQGARLTTW